MTKQKTRAFFGIMKEWSDRKLRLLDGYLASAAKIFSKTQPPLYYVDGFAGQGIYGDGNKGSPIRAAEIAAQYKAEGKAYDFRCINIEEDKQCYETLKEATADFGELVINLPGTFADNVDRILEIAGSHPMICFLDPFGIEGVDWAAIEKLILRSAPTDLWVRFDPRTAQRLAGFFDTEGPLGAGKLTTLSRVYGINDLEYLRRALEGPTPEKRVQNAIALYEKRLAETYVQTRPLRAYRMGFAHHFEVRSVEGHNKGWMIFASAHYKGAFLARDIVYSAEENYQRDAADYKQAGTLKFPTLFPIDPTPDEIFSAKAERLKEDIWNRCRGETLSRIDVAIRVWDDWFGTIKNAHINAALNALRSPSDGRIITATGATSDEKTVFTFRTDSTI